MVEFCLSAGIFLSFLIGAIQFALAIFSAACLQHSLDKTARLAILLQRDSTQVMELMREHARAYGFELDPADLCVCSENSSLFPDNCACGQVDIGTTGKLVSFSIKRTFHVLERIPIAQRANVIVRNE